ncbi:MAG: hypothetical protein ACIAS6_03285 [Phycisphaerales bacterium JB060]
MDEVVDGVWLRRMRMIARLVIRVAAGILIILAIKEVAGTVPWLFMQAGPGGFEWYYLAATGAALVVQGGGGVMLLLFEPTVARWLVPSPGQGCPSCGYPVDAKGSIEMCPECGVRLSGSPRGENVS